MNAIIIAAGMGMRLKPILKRFQSQMI